MTNVLLSNYSMEEMKSCPRGAPCVGFVGSNVGKSHLLNVKIHEKASLDSI